MFVSDIDLQNKEISRLKTLNTSNFIQLNQDSIIDSAVCTTLCVLLDVYLRKNVPYFNCVPVFFNNIKKNLAFIKNALKNQKMLLWKYIKNNNHQLIRLTSQILQIMRIIFVEKPLI